MLHEWIRWIIAARTGKTTLRRRRWLHFLCMWMLSIMPMVPMEGKKQQLLHWAMLPLLCTPEPVNSPFLLRAKFMFSLLLPHKRFILFPLRFYIWLEQRLVLIGVETWHYLEIEVFGLNLVWQIFEGKIKMEKNLFMWISIC